MVFLTPPGELYYLLEGKSSLNAGNLYNIYNIIYAPWFCFYLTMPFNHF